MNREKIICLAIVTMLMEVSSAFIHGLGPSFVSRNPSTSLFSSIDDERPIDPCDDYFDDKFDAEELKKFTIITGSDKNAETEETLDLDDLPIPDEVHIILFNPDTENEGIHTLEYPKGSGNNIVLAFESPKECEKFSDTLWGQDFYEPQPQEIPYEALLNYCESIGVNVQVVPRGTPIIPPEESTDDLGLNPNLESEKEFLDQMYDLSFIDTESNHDMGDDSEGAWD